MQNQNYDKVKGKKDNRKFMLIAICVLAVAVVGLCGYIYFTKDGSNTVKYSSKNNDINAKNQSSEKKVEVGDSYSSSDSEDVNTTQKSVTNSTSTSSSSTIIFDGSKSINSSIKNYTLSAGAVGIWASVDSTQKTLTFSFSPLKVKEIYPISWNDTATESSEIKFSKKIVELFFGGMGQDVSGDTIFMGNNEYKTDIYI